MTLIGPNCQIRTHGHQISLCMLSHSTSVLAFTIMMLGSGLSPLISGLWGTPIIATKGDNESEFCQSNNAGLHAYGCHVLEAMHSHLAQGRKPPGRMPVPRGFWDREHVSCGHISWSSYEHSCIEGRLPTVETSSALLYSVRWRSCFLRNEQIARI